MEFPYVPRHGETIRLGEGHRQVLAGPLKVVLQAPTDEQGHVQGLRPPDHQVRRQNEAVGVAEDPRRFRPGSQTLRQRTSGGGMEGHRPQGTGQGSQVKIVPWLTENMPGSGNMCVATICPAAGAAGKC
jgi:hypothetical protein